MKCTYQGADVLLTRDMRLSNGCKQRRGQRLAAGLLCAALRGYSVQGYGAEVYGAIWGCSVRVCGAVVFGDEGLRAVVCGAAGL